MPKDKTENHEKIVMAAKKEFMIYGFKDASMRRIASDSGMSVSGLYKHFKSKEDMFSALVEPVYDDFVRLYRKVADETRRTLNMTDISHIWERSDEIVQIMKYIYENFDTFYLIICKSEGTGYEDFLHDMAKLGEEVTLELMKQLTSMGVKLNDFSMKEFHLLMTTYVDAVFQAVRHNFTKDEAYRYAETLDNFFTPAWKTFFGY